MDDHTTLSDPLLNVGDTAQLLGVTDRYVRKLVAERRLPVVKVGRLVRIRKTALKTYIRDNTRAPR